MVVFRAALFVLLLAAGILFALFAFTGKSRYKRLGLLLLKWTLIAAFAFFAVLAVENVLA